MRACARPLTLALMLVIATVPLLAQKPVKKPARPTTPRIVKGTTQLPGDNGAMGVTYTMGRADDALNFTLLRAEYSASRAAFKTDPVFPAANEKLLILTYTVHNPNPRDMSLNWRAFRFTVVDSENVNRVGAPCVIKEETGEAYNLQLKPAQKVEAVGVIKLPAGESAPKLIVERGTGNPILRYYFDGTPQHAKNVVKPLAAPFADPADSKGSVARAEVPAEVETYYPLRAFDLKVTTGAYLPTAIGAVRPTAKEQMFVVNFTCRNATLVPQGRRWSTFGAELTTSDGEKNKLAGLFKSQRDETIGDTQQPGEEYQARLLFRIPKGVTASKLTVWEGDSRKFVFDVSGLK